MNDKYIVFKVDDLDDLIVDSDGLSYSSFESIALPDAEVIRHQDIFSESGLWAYAHAVRSHIELLELQGYEVPHQFYTIADHFADAAQRAHDHPTKKIPD